MLNWVLIAKSQKDISIINISSNRRKSVERLRSHLVSDIENTHEDIINEWNCDNILMKKLDYITYMTKKANKEIKKIEDMRKKSFRWRGEKFMILHMRFDKKNWIVLKKSFKGISVLNVASSHKKAIRRLRRFLVTEIENTHDDIVDEWNSDTLFKKVTYKPYMTRKVNGKIFKIENRQKESFLWKGTRYFVLQYLPAIQHDNQISA